MNSKFLLKPPHDDGPVEQKNAIRLNDFTQVKSVSQDLSGRKPADDHIIVSKMMWVFP